MATIRVRHVPEEVHRIYRIRAAAAGMSLQEYVLSELERSAHLRTPAELVAEVEAGIRAQGIGGLASSSSASLPRGDRDAH